MATIDDDLAKTVTETFRQAQIDISNQDKFLVGPGDVTLTRADGTTFTGPSLPKMAGITTSAMQWRGGIPASSNLNNFGPTSAYTGVWGQSSVSVTAADLANGYPAAERGVLEVFAGGRNNGTQRYTTDGGRFFIRWLAAAWNATSPQWSDWVEIGGLSSNTVLSSSVTSLSDATAFAQNQTYVLAGIRTDSPVGLTAGQNNAIIMSMRRGGGTIMGLHQTLFTAVGTYERYGAPNAATGWTSVSWYNGGDANGWRLIGADAMSALGMGIASQSLVANFDWQQADFFTEKNIYTQYNTWVNAPTGISYISGASVSVKCILAQNNRYVLRIYSLGDRPEYIITTNGAKGSRTFEVMQSFNSGTNTKIPITNGGTGQTNAAAARKALGLDGVGGYDDANRIEQNSTSPDTVIQNMKNYALVAFRSIGDTGGNANNYSIPQGAPSVFSRTLDTWFTLSVPYFANSTNPIKVLSGYGASGISATRTLLDSGNTTVDANGFVKRASPIISIYKDGSFKTNEESEGCVVSRVSEGQYLISGCIGLNADAAWGGIDGGFEIPLDRNKQPRIWLDYEVSQDGSVLVKTYHRTHPSAPKFARNEREGIGDGDPVDIPADSFISVRVEMPEDSIYNKKMEEAAQKLAEEEADRIRAEQERQEAEVDPKEQPDVQQ